LTLYGRRISGLRQNRTSLRLLSAAFKTGAMILERLPADVGTMTADRF
jgi:hypothetical protein